MLALKNNGDYTKVVKTVHKCNKCNAENNIDFDLNNINTKYSLDINDSYETELNGLNFKLVLSYPTLLDQIEYDRIHAVNKAKESDKASYELYSTLFESNLIYIREIYCNGEIIDDFTNIGMKDKLTFLNRLNNKLVNIDKIITFIIERSNPISIDFECHKCTAINSNITIKTDNFII